jgi:hypothetical protein
MSSFGGCGQYFGTVHATRQCISHAMNHQPSCSLFFFPRFQELLVYLAMFIRTEPNLFSEVLRMRVGLIIQVRGQ